MKKSVFILLFLLLIYTRFVGLDWGLPYPMHPDERNMASAIQSLNCEIRNQKFEIRNCFNPHFFAYGQFPLYAGYILIQIVHLVTQKLFIPITFYEAVMSLRVISAVASILTVLFLIRIVRLLYKKLSFLYFIFYILFFIFQPYFIQFSHFGTTESLLMLFYSLIIYYSLQLFNSLRLDRSKLEWRTIFFLSLFSGLAIATKISSVLFIAVPVFTVLLGKYSIGKKFVILFLLIVGTVFFAIFFSPHTLISFHEFLGSMRYESLVATGILKVFYTRQFDGSLPVWFQLTKIFPFVLGFPQFIFAFLGFLFLSWKQRELNLLRFAFLVYFIPNSFLYTKWTRFMAPLFPIVSLFAIMGLVSMNRFIGNTIKSKIKFASTRPRRDGSLKSKVNFQFTYFLSFIFCLLFLIPGSAYLSIYQHPDVRFSASDWIYKNIPENSYILSESANVVDIPVESKKFYQMVSFNFYDLDQDIKLQEELKMHLAKADYIFVPSRRIFKNHVCLKKSEIRSTKSEIISKFKILNCEYLKTRYAFLHAYYHQLFSGELGFKKIAEFTSYPKISLFGKTLFEFPDEAAEETWSVFDHPLIRIYQKI